MCLQKKWITNPVTGVRVLVNCGHCEACQQEKANKRTQRINLNNVYGVDNGTVTLFVTLTYRNDYVPFIFEKDYRRFIHLECDTLPVYRLSHRHLSRSKKKRALVYYDKIESFNNYEMPNLSKFDLKTTSNCYVQSMLYKYGSDCFSETLPYLVKSSHADGLKIRRKYDDGKIGVILYSDVQKFLKRFRINMLRHYGIKNKIDFFSCSEYGPTSMRPHHHLLITVPSSAVTFAKRAVAESWKFDNLACAERFKKQIKIADKGASSYVSSYVNCSADFPFFLKTFRPFRPKHVYSQGYGCRSNYCKLPSLLEMSRRHQFSFERVSLVGGTQQTITVPLPSYSLRRFFPQFKGFSRLTDYEILALLQHPQKFRDYAKTLDYTDDDIHSIVISLRNHYLRYCKVLHIKCNDFTLNQYAHDYIDVWRSYKSYLIKFSYEKVLTNRDYLYHFLNWSDYIWSDQLADIIESQPYEDSLYCDPNQFDDNVIYHLYLVSLFDGYNKTKRVKNSYYSINSNV